MKLEIITIGDEILIGQILDSNSKWIAEELTKIGVSVYQITSIQDSSAHIVSALNQALERVDIVIFTGGLGPTKDDVTKNTLTTYFNDELVLNEKVVEHIQKMFAKINYPFTEVNRKQAYVPSKCKVLFNNYGTAPGMWFEINNKVVISLPGVPTEMKGLISNEVIPALKKKYKLPYIMQKTIQTYGMGESMVAARIADWEENLPNELKLAYLPSFGRVRLRISGKSSNKEKLEKLINEEVDKLSELISDIIVGFSDNEVLEMEVGKIMTQNKISLSVAESCTGGNLSKMITSVPGSSKYFRGAIIAYNEEIKMKELHVLQETIINNSVVSSEVAIEMAKGAKQKFNSDYAIATTGNAGPTKDKTDASVGVVYIAIATPTTILYKEFNFGQPREKVIQRASNKALEMLRKEILKN